MINEQVLLSSLISAFERIKTLDAAQSMLVTEISALRETLKELLGDDRFEECLQKHRLAQMAKGVVTDTQQEELNNVSIEIIREHLVQ